MKNILLATTALFAFTGAANAREFKVSGGEASAAYQYWFAPAALQTVTVSGRAQTDLGNNRFAIIGGTLFNYDFTSGNTQFQVEAHRGHTLDNGTSVGGFIAYENWWGGAFSILIPGIEIARDTGPWSFEGFAGIQYELGFAVTTVYAGADAMYAVNDNFSVGLRTTLYGSPGAWDFYPALVARYDFDNGMFAEGNTTADIWNGGIDRSIGFRIGYVFGEKPTFGSRDWSSRSGGW